MKILKRLIHHKTGDRVAIIKGRFDGMFGTINYIDIDDKYEIISDEGEIMSNVEYFQIKRLE